MKRSFLVTLLAAASIAAGGWILAQRSGDMRDPDQPRSGLQLGCPQGAFQHHGARLQHEP